jgi:hypothetical protein
MQTRCAGRFLAGILLFTADRYGLRASGKVHMSNGAAWGLLATGRVKAGT